MRMYLARRRVSHIDEAVLHSARNAYHIARLGIEPPPVCFIKIAPLENAKDFCLRVAMSRRSLAGCVDGLDEAELARARLRRHAHEEIEPDSGDLYGKLCPAGVKE